MHISRCDNFICVKQVDGFGDKKKEDAFGDAEKNKTEFFGDMKK